MNAHRLGQLAAELPVPTPEAVLERGLQDPYAFTLEDLDAPLTELVEAARRIISSSVYEEARASRVAHENGLGERAAELLDQLRALRQPPDPEPGELVQEIVEELARNTGKRVKVHSGR
jgi:hypothetical protein